MKNPNHTLSIFILDVSKRKSLKPWNKDIVSLDRRRTDRKLRPLPFSDLPLIGPNRLPIDYLAA